MVPLPFRFVWAFPVMSSSGWLLPTPLIPICSGGSCSCSFCSCCSACKVLPACIRARTSRPKFRAVCSVFRTGSVLISGPVQYFVLPVFFFFAQCDVRHFVAKGFFEFVCPDRLPDHGKAFRYGRHDTPCPVFFQFSAPVFLSVLSCHDVTFASDCTLDTLFGQPVCTGLCKKTNAMADRREKPS